MEHNNLTGIACARPIIYAEGLFASCYLDNGKFIPEEGIKQGELWSILNGDLLRSGSDLVEDFTLNCKLRHLQKSSTDTYELASFTGENKNKSLPQCNIPPEETDLAKDRKDLQVEGIPLLQISLVNENDSSLFTQNISGEELEKRRTYEKQVSWIMDDTDGEEFVSMETFTRFHDALILLDVLKKHNIPSVVSFLARRDERIAITFSKIDIGLDCLMFCLFQA